MTMALKNIRNLITAKIEDINGFALVKLPPQYFGRVQNTLAHKGFTVDVKSSQDSGVRQRRAGIIFQCVFTVSFAFRLRPKDMYPTDYDLCLDAEELVIKACLESYNANIQIRYLRSTRTVQASMEYAIISIDFNILHSI